MSLNKNTSYILIHLLNGNNTAKKISELMQGIDIRSLIKAKDTVNNEPPNEEFTL